MDATCRNCGTPLQGEYCHRCGQPDRHYLRNILYVVGDLFGEIGHWDSRVSRTLKAVIFSPGRLSLAFKQGQLARYVPPLRLYFFTSLIVFLMLSVVFDIDQISVNQQQKNLTAEEIRQSDFRLDFLDDEAQVTFDERVAYLANNPKLLIKRVFSLAPQVLLCMLPIFALLLKLFYIRRHHYYIEHLVVALHSHTFLLLTILTITLFGSAAEYLAQQQELAWLQNALNFAVTMLVGWLPIYMLLTQKRYYQQGWLKTIVKYGLIFVCYNLLLSCAFIALIVWGVVTA